MFACTWRITIDYTRLIHWTLQLSASSETKHEKRDFTPSWTVYVKKIISVKLSSATYGIVPIWLDMYHLLRHLNILLRQRSHLELTSYYVAQVLSLSSYTSISEDVLLSSIQHTSEWFVISIGRFPDFSSPQQICLITMFYSKSLKKRKVV